jgi:hypothetical protein
MGVAAALDYAGVSVPVGRAGWGILPAVLLLAPPAAWWLTLVPRSAGWRDAARAAGQAAASLALAGLILLAGSLLPGRIPAVGFLALAWIAMAHQLWRRRWLFRRTARPQLPV